jgi:hypothetical protein
MLSQLPQYWNRIRNWIVKSAKVKEDDSGIEPDLKNGFRNLI